MQLAFSLVGLAFVVYVVYVGVKNYLKGGNEK